MATLPSKRLRLLLVAFLFLCFITTTAARSLRETVKSSLLSQNIDNKKVNSNVFDPKQEVHELATMDYTPAGKNPPIHN
ncbi:hypothetical protein HN51_059340 [Arachis hypogaea]|uniref:CLAVATA3/ESR (CLE)-related protein n=1 Tax=Arachis hypogaea TaxID=3818 RepID=A0A444X530_ARAHY|nr:uncharacterized protein LOC107621825 isoform X2 [Arachis ipaensis]RYQ84790.1 hypothetical protein Ahy_B10g104268 isoform B [Arachis hypogaea]